MKTWLRLSAAECQSNLTRIKYAELLIEQLPITHEGASTWLMNYGTGHRGEELRAKRGLVLSKETESAVQK